MNLAIEVDNRQNHLDLVPASLVTLARHVLSGEGITQAAISIVLVDNSTIQTINREHLAHDWPTDVITFPLTAPGQSPLEAELIISVEMAVDTSAESGADPLAELSLYLVHGLLHLCGYNDRMQDEVAAMRWREAEILEREGIVNTFSMVGPAGQGGAS